jgi:transcriptional regulator of acetoin/glycerol metabolism
MLEEHKAILSGLSRKLTAGHLSPAEFFERAYKLGGYACHVRLMGEPIEGLNLAEVEKQAILRALDAKQGDVRAAAQVLGIGKTTLYRKIREFVKSDHPRFCEACGQYLRRNRNKRRDSKEGL